MYYSCSEVTLYTYTGEPINVIGEVKLAVQYGNQKMVLPLIIIAIQLVGRHWVLPKRSAIMTGVHHYISVSKEEGNFRICGDCKVNLALQFNQYPLAGGKRFTTLALSQAYLQSELDEDSSKCTTVNTHKGLYHYKLLPFRIGSVPAIIFQKTMDTILLGSPNYLLHLQVLMTYRTSGHSG